MSPDDPQQDAPDPWAAPGTPPPDRWGTYGTGHVQGVRPKRWPRARRPAWIAAGVLGTGAILAGAVWFMTAAEEGRLRQRDILGPLVTASAGAPEETNVEDLKPGDCVSDVGDEDAESLPVVPCAKSHRGEVFEVTDFPGGSYPGDDELIVQADRLCGRGLAGYVGVATPDDATYDIDYFYPVRESWSDGDRALICLLEDPDGHSLTGSARG